MGQNLLGGKVAITGAMMDEVADLLEESYSKIGDLLMQKPHEEADAWSCIAIANMLAKAEYMSKLFTENLDNIQHLKKLYLEQYELATIPSKETN